MARLVGSLNLIPPGWYYLLLLAAFIAEGTSFPLIHIPSAVMFLASAYLAFSHRISLTAAILVASLGSAVGGYITYWLGTRMAPADGLDQGGPGGALKSRAARGGLAAFWVSPARLERVQQFVGRYGALIALAARWLGILRPAALLGTGLARVKPWKVMPALFLGSLLYCAFYQLLAEGLAAVSLRLLARVELQWLLIPVVGLGLAWLAGLYLIRRARL